MNTFEDYKKIGLRFWEYPPVIFMIFSATLLSLIYLISYNFALSLALKVSIGILMTLLIAIFGYIIFISFSRIINLTKKEVELNLTITNQLKIPLDTFKWSLILLKEYFVSGSPIRKISFLIETLIKVNDTMIQTSEIILKRTSLLTFFSIPKPRSKFVSLGSLTAEIITSLSKEEQAQIYFNQSKSLSTEVIANQAGLSKVINDLIDAALRSTSTSDNQSLRIQISEEAGNFRWSITGQNFIPQNWQKNLFNPPAEGTEISNLYLTNLLIEMMNGRLGFETSYDQGFTYWFALPKSSG